MLGPVDDDVGDGLDRTICVEVYGLWISSCMMQDVKKPGIPVGRVQQLKSFHGRSGVAWSDSVQVCELLRLRGTTSRFPHEQQNCATHSLDSVRIMEL